MRLERRSITNHALSQISGTPLDPKNPRFQKKNPERH